MKVGYLVAASALLILGLASKADGAYNRTYIPCNPNQENRCPVDGLQAVLEKEHSLEVDD